MPTYKYKAISREGESLEGVVEAYDELAAIDQVRDSALVVISIHQVSGKKSLLAMEIGSKKIGLKPLSLICSQFGIILTAGMPIARAVHMISTQTKDKRIRSMLEQVAADVDAGYSLADSFENKGKEMLPPTFIETIRAGEESGTLENSFTNLQTYFESQAKMKDKVKSALTYPMFLLAMAGVVIAIVLGVAMPVFTDMFGQMDITLPGLTLWVIHAANTFRERWYAVVIVLLLLLMMFKVYSNSEKGRLRLAKFQMKIPAIGPVVQMKASSQLANTLATLLAAGLPLLRAVAITARVMDNYYMGIQLGSMTYRLEEGRSLGECLEACKCFPQLLVEMAAMGEETGTLEETLKTIGFHFDNEVNIVTARALGMLQPAITVILGIVIGTIVIALYLPMFTMYSGM